MALFSETKQSLRWWLIIISVLSLYSTIGEGDIVLGASDTFDLIVLPVSIILNLITLYIGIRFVSLMQSSSKGLIRFFWLLLAWNLLVAIYAIASNSMELGLTWQLGVPLGGVLVDFYILMNIKRLSKISV